ncbi:MAG: hypothetical protein KAG93_03745 [Desulfuromusa sp.]|nr:hypothetical protein [Desulfuromusa sp.]
MPNNSSGRNKPQLQSVTSQEKLQRWGSILILIIILGLLPGCAADHSVKNKELLSQNYQTLSDEDLTLYYYELNDQIKAVERDNNNSSISLGFGMGSYGSNSGRSGGVGVTSSGGHADGATNLRDRRNEVKLELKKRDLKP